MESIRCRSVEKSSSSPSSPPVTNIPNCSVVYSHTSNNPPSKCYICHGFEHISFDCLSIQMNATSFPKQVAIFEKELRNTDLNEKVCKFTDDECEHDLAVDAH